VRDKTDMKTQNKANKSSEEKQSLWEKPFFKFYQKGWEKIRNWFATFRLKNIFQLFFKPPNAPNKRLLVRSIVLIFFLSWTFLLGSETWAIQQSCTPMIQPVQKSDIEALGDRCKPPCLEPNIVVDDKCVPPPPTCSEGQELVDGKCVSPPPTCSEGQELVDGKCPPPPITCPGGQELVDGKCPPPPIICLEGQELVDGKCPPPPIICPEGQELVNGKCPPPKYDPRPDLIGLGAGAAAASIAAVTSAPVAVVAGVGFAVWWIVRNLANGGD
jgi:hypothetical protein